MRVPAWEANAWPAYSYAAGQIPPTVRTSGGELAEDPQHVRGNPRTPLYMLVPLIDDRRPREALERIHVGSEEARQRRNQSIQRPSAGARVVTGDLIPVIESDSSLHRQGMGPKLVHEKWTGPWKGVEVVIEGRSVIIEMEGAITRSRTVSAASLKPFYMRLSYLRHSMEDEFAQMAWRADLGSECTRLQQHQRTRPWTGGGWSTRQGREMGVPRPEPRQGGVGLGLGGGGIGRLHTAAIGHAARVSERVRSQQRAEPHRSPRQGGRGDTPH